MHENKFTPRAEEALRLAQEAAEELGHGYVGSEHLLLALSDSGIEWKSEYLIPSAFDNPKEAREAFKAVMRLPDPPTCILMSDDTTAITAIQLAKDMHFSVPGNISIGGYDGVRLSLMFTPALTTVRQDTVTMGKAAADELISLIESTQENVHRHISVPALFIPGESIGKIQ